VKFAPTPVGLVLNAARERFDNNIPAAVAKLSTVMNHTCVSKDLTVWREAAATMVSAKEYERAADVLECIHEVEPWNPEPCYQLAALWDTVGDWNKAAAWISQAYRRLGSSWGQTITCTLYGDILYKLGETETAARMWDRALAAPNQDGSSLFAKAEILLARGEWAEGWKLFEARWHTAEAWRTQKLHQTDLRSLPPEWDGKAAGRVLVCAEQGSGDTLMMLRYVPFVENHVLVCQPEILPLVRTRWPEITAVANGERVEAEWSVPLMSLALKLGFLEYPINGWTGTHSRERTGALRLGVCWKGSPDHGNDRDRSSPIDFRTAFAMDGVEIVSLQHGEPTKFRDFAATAEVIESCDAVVTVDTSVFHLAGTLGVPTYVIPPTRPELRFPLTHETTTPWYPSCTVVRRRKSSDWDAAIADVRSRVRAMV